MIFLPHFVRMISADHRSIVNRLSSSVAEVMKIEPAARMRSPSKENAATLAVCLFALLLSTLGSADSDPCVAVYNGIGVRDGFSDAL